MVSKKKLHCFPLKREIFALFLSFLFQKIAKVDIFFLGKYSFSKSVLTVSVVGHPKKSLSMISKKRKFGFSSKGRF